MSHAERMKTAICLYLNYLVHGMAIVILAQNMIVLGKEWHVGDAGVAYVISSLGIGRLIVLYLGGEISDRMGRRFMVKIGVVTYALFFVGILISKNMYEAYFFGILAGMANSFLDTGTYPALMELFPRKQASANILIKAFVSVGELILPIFVASLEHFDLWYGWSFSVCAVLLAANFVFLWNREFPDMAAHKAKRAAKLAAKQAGQTPVEAAAANPAEPKQPLTGSQWALGIVLTIFGYVSMSTFYLISQWLTQYGKDVVNLDMTHARLLVSIYSIGSISGVLLTVILVERVLKPAWFMLLDTTISFITLLLMASTPVLPVMLVGSFVIGASAASGVMQMGMTIMGIAFPKAKGRITGIYNMAGALSSFTIPIVTGVLSKTSVHSIMWFDVFIAAIGIVCSLCVILIFKKSHVSVTEEVA